MRSIKNLAAIASLAASSLAHGQVAFETASNLNAAISDNGYNGTLASMTCVTILAAGGGLVSGVAVSLYVDHTWIGDLTLKVVSPSNTIVTLMSRPGYAEAADDGTLGNGDDSNLDSANPIQFIDGSAASAETMASTLTSSQAACRDDGICNYDPNNGSASAGKLAAFNGQGIAGSWKFCAGDSGSGDIGAIQKVRLTFATGILQISPAVLDFGSIVQGTTSTEQFVTLTNNGNAALKISSLSLALDPYQRTVAGTCGNSLPRVIPAGEACTLSYTFLPMSQDSVSQPFTVQTDGSGDSGFQLRGSGDAVFADGFDSSQ